MLDIAPPRPYRHQAGVTLIELMIAVAVVALIAMIAYPSFQDSVRKSRRAEAINALASVQQAQERSRGNFPSYCANLASAPTASVCGLNQPTSTANGRYALAVESADANSYVAVATAQGGQAADTRCLKMGVQASAGQVRYGSSSGTINWTPADPDANRCWAK